MHFKARVTLAQITAGVLALSAHVTYADVRNADPGTYRNVLSSLAAGDTLLLASGTYLQGLPLNGMNGTAAQPIVIRGPDDQSAIFVARDCCNTVQLGDTSHVQVHNLTLDGAGLDGPFGVDTGGPTHHILIEGLRIINHGAQQQVVGISTKAPAWNWIIRRNTIIGAGTGIYLGNSDGTQPFVAGLIEHNLIIDTLGYNMQIKHQQPRPSGIGLPTGMSRTIIRHNVFSKSGNSSTGGLARPNLLVGHFPLSGTGSSDRYEIYGNFFYQNPTEALFQGEGNIGLHDNVFVSSSGTAINIQPHEGEVRDVAVYHNTVVANGTGIRISGGAAGYTQRIVGNASFAATAISGPGQLQNVTGTYAAAATELNAPQAAIASLDLFPKSGRLTGAAIDLSGFAHYVDGTKDFDGRTRTGTTRGAYEGGGSNTGWKLALAIKPQGGVGAPGAPGIALNANPTQVSLQGSSTLDWSVTDATSCTASNAWSGSKPFTGSESVGPLAGDATFTLTCSGAGGSTSHSVTVTVANNQAAPVVSLSAAPTSVDANGTSQLSWNSSNATACTAANAWSGSKALSGSESTGPLASARTYSLTCTGPGGSDTSQVTVAVQATTPAPTPAPAAAPGKSGGGSFDPWWLLVCAARFARARRKRGM